MCMHDPLHQNAGISKFLYPIRFVSLGMTFEKVCVIRESLDMEENTLSCKAGILKLHCVKRVLFNYYSL